MSRKQLILVYVIFLFMMVWGFDLITSLKYGENFSVSAFWNIFSLCALFYAGSTLLLVRAICKKLYRTRRYGWLVLALLGAVVYFIVVRYLLEQIILPNVTDARNYPPNVSFRYYVLDNAYYASIYVVLGLLFFLLENQAYNEKKQADLERQTREAELQFLRSQVNPHFLFNTLNNIYSLAYERSSKTADAILRLSDLMRYMLYEKKKYVEITREWQYISSLVELQRLRFEYELPVQMELEGKADGTFIPPYFLIPFVENAFKHGDFTDKDSPLSIRLSIKERGWEFETQNKISHKNKDAMGGVGLDNIRRRLEILYPGQYSMDIYTEGDRFSLRLSLNNLTDDQMPGGG
jgi:two-component system LytT family sensor kinase